MGTGVESEINGNLQEQGRALRKGFSQKMFFFFLFIGSLSEFQIVFHWLYSAQHRVSNVVSPCSECTYITVHMH